ncbi:hypothetical protein [Allobranchiibius sp. CTAmp26]|uniref:hypothetical protein n=1 Tax=Allobranchiibius sp. CTAmp26 TaxID=2815214 RepID=UPI001AA1AE91|nr:hypothetical protein [Allobranchiibius sp. CTAmp26]MBO1755701.1 hypothetical protein [Allobranchiibius sp. CTAmp26]
MHASFSRQLASWRKAKERHALLAWVPEISPLTNTVHVHAIIRTSHALNVDAFDADVRLLGSADEVGAWCTYILKDLSDVATRMGALSLGGLDTMHSFYGPGGLNQILKHTTS